MELQSLVRNQSEINDFLFQQMKARIHVVDERKDKLRESISALRVSIDDMLREKEDELVNDLNRMRDELKILLETRLVQNERIVHKGFDSCEHLTQSSEKYIEKSHPIDFQPDTFQQLLSKDFESSTLFDDLDLRLDIDERFRRVIARLQSFPLGRITIVESNGCSSKVLQTSAKDTDIQKFRDSIKEIEDEHFGYRTNLKNSEDLQQMQQTRFSTQIACVSSQETPPSETVSDTISTNSNSDHSSVSSFTVGSNSNETAPTECLHDNGTLSRNTSTAGQSTKKLSKYALRIRNYMSCFRECSKRDVNEKLIGSGNIEPLSANRKLAERHLSASLKADLNDFEASFDLSQIKPHNKQTNEMNNDQIIEDNKESEYETEMTLTPTLIKATALDDACKNVEQAFHTNTFINWLASIPRSPNEVAVLSGKAHDEAICWLTDVILLPGSEYIVVFDAMNRNLKKFEILTRKFLHRIYLHSEKSNICLFSATEIAATLPEEKKIVFVSYSNNLEISREVSTDRKYRGITCITTKKQLVCSTFYEMCIDILSFDCILLTSIKPSSLNIHEYFFPGYLAASEDGDILISDSVNKRVLCLNIHTLTVKFSYYGQDNCLLTWPAGVAVDKKGHIYIADCFKNTIHMLTPEGKFDRFFMSEGDGVGKYRAIDVNDDMLVTTTYSKSDIGVYLLTQQLKISGL